MVSNKGTKPIGRNPRGRDLPAAQEIGNSVRGFMVCCKQTIGIMLAFIAIKLPSLCAAAKHRKWAIIA